MQAKKVKQQGGGGGRFWETMSASLRSQAPLKGLPGFPTEPPGGRGETRWGT